MLGFADAEQTKGLWETLIVKSGFVISDGSSPRDMFGWMLGANKSIRVDELAAFMIDAAMNGREESTIQDNEAVVKKGREVLAKMKKGDWVLRNLEPSSTTSSLQDPV